ncbi:MAG: BlaI/MecI/CopY family transcriptional regulator [Actinomycetota bacterium]|nr:BlaI/MecI/CopY family transcriptional regulator [Actinomycetota bacterium]
MRLLGQLEAVVMHRLWSYGRPVAVREVLEDLREDRTIAYTTVMTVMDNLRRKGFLTRELVGRAYRYVPVQSREEHNAAVMGEVLAGSSDRATTLMRFVEQMPLEEVAKLRQVLASRAPNRKGRRR